MVELLFADATNVRCVPVIGGRLTAAGVVVSLIETQVLGRLRRRLGTIGYDRIECSAQQLRVIYVGTSHDDGQWAAIGFHQYAALHPVFRTVCRVRTDMVPPKRALLIAPSADCHSQFTPPSSSHSSVSAAHMRSNMPSCSQR